MRATYIFFITLLSLLLLSVIASTDPSDNIEVNTPFGPIRGYLQNDKKSYAFRGIPYAKAKRWEYSTFVDAWTDVYDAQDDSPGFPQNCTLPPSTCPTTTNENAFSVNIFTPLDIKSDKKYPIMVWFHGGNYRAGSNSSPLYNGTSYANLDTIVVTVNYRLGSLGFHVDPLLSASKDADKGNFGFLDQVLALQWVQKSLGSFQGDITNVTIFGQSAGAGGVASHLISPKSKGLYHRAIVQSNPFAIPFRTPASRDAWIDSFRSNTNCHTTECFQSLTTEQIIAAQDKTERDIFKLIFKINLLSVFLPWTPYVDGDVIPDQPLNAFKKGLVQDIPIILGTVGEEADLFIYEAFDSPMSAFNYKLFVSLIFGQQGADKVVAKFPPDESPTADNRELMSHIATQFIFQCSNRYALNALTLKISSTHLYSYHFDHVMSFGRDAWGPDFPMCWERDCHAEELPFTWNNAQWMYKYSDDEQAMSDELSAYWVNFAYTGHPDVGPAKDFPAHGLLSWPSYPLSGQEIVLSTDMKTVSDFLKDDCDFWDSVGYF